MEKKEEKPKSKLMVATPDGDLVISENFFAIVAEEEGARSLMMLSAPPEQAITIAQALAHALLDILSRVTGIEWPEDGKGKGMLAQIKELQEGA